MTLLAQDKEYNCGIFSIWFLLFLYGIESNTEELEVQCQCTQQDGTSHDGMLRGLYYYPVFPFSVSSSKIVHLQQSLPAIVNYQSEDDGHYSVIISKVGDNFVLYDPADGEIKLMLVSEFEKVWYSDRYGKEWFLSISLKTENEAN